MSSISEAAKEIASRLEPIYKDLHRNPELSLGEHRTAGIVAEALGSLGLEVISSVGGTGVVGILRNGDGPVVMLRADMDALPVLEDTGLDYASTARGTDPDGNDVPVMHACGHDMHVTALLGAVELLKQGSTRWKGTVVAAFQPAEEVAVGARAMVSDGLFDRAPRPSVVLGQHVAPLPAGMLGLHSGAAFAGADQLTITMHGRGGHGSRPETTIDPVVMAAATVMRLQSVIAREVAGGDSAVLTVGQIHAGTKHNIIPNEAVMGLSVRSSTVEVRERLMSGIERIVKAEAAASGAEREPEIVLEESLPVLVNDPAATARTRAAFHATFTQQAVMDPGPVTGSEDVGIISDAAGVPLCYWLLGGADPTQFAAAEAAGTMDRDIPSNHSPHFAPLINPTLETGIVALAVAATKWLDPAS